VSKLRVSVVEYLNKAPLVWGFTHGPLEGEYELSFTVPSLCAEALRKREADVAILPAIEVQRVEGLVVLPELAIASKQRVRSLLLIAKKPMGEARRVALDASSRSTQALVKILCQRHWNTAPEYLEATPDLGEMLERADAALVIGDPALRLAIGIEGRSRTGPSGEQICDGAAAGVSGAGTLHVYDVVEEWNRLTNLPAVLAVWAGWPEKLTPRVAADFLASAEYGFLHIEEICASASPKLGLPAAVLETYLRENIDYALSGASRSGLELYFQLAAEQGLIAGARALRWVGAGVKAEAAPAAARG